MSEAIWGAVVLAVIFAFGVYVAAGLPLPWGVEQLLWPDDAQTRDDEPPAR